MNVDGKIKAEEFAFPKHKVEEVFAMEHAPDSRGDAVKRPRHSRPSENSEGNVSVDFLLKCGLFVVAFIGGLLAYSVSLAAIAVRDLGDALADIMPIVLEGRSGKAPDDVYTFGYGRYKVIAAVFIGAALIAGALAIVALSLFRIVFPVDFNSIAMVVISIVGLAVEGYALYRTLGHRLSKSEDISFLTLAGVFGWVVVLVGAAAAHVTGMHSIDAVAAIIVAVVVMCGALANLGKPCGILLDRAPKGLSARNIRRTLEKVPEVGKVGSVNVWQVDGDTTQAVVSVAVFGDGRPIDEVKREIRECLKVCGIDDVAVDHEVLSRSEEYELRY